MSRTHYFIGSILFFILIPQWVFASLRISEVMYSLPGADTGREWIEIFNTGSEDVLVSEWRVFENSTNHKLNLVLGNDLLSPGGYAIVADNAEKFLTDNPSFNGTLFDSAFSLHNTGEVITLRDSELIDRDTVTYSSEWGADGDGKSLINKGDLWEAGLPTPGTGLLSIVVDQSAESRETVTSGSTLPIVPVEPQIFAYVRGEDEVTVGADSVFTGIGLGIVGEPLENARYVWSFGDGARAEGEQVLHHYRYPGTYVVVLDIASGKFTATDRMTVIAHPAHVFIEDANQSLIEVHNNDTREINLSWWILASGDSKFVIPEHTIILPNQSVSFPAEITGLQPSDRTLLSLQYPNGRVVKPVPVSQEIPSTQQDETKHVSTMRTSLVGHTVSTETESVPQREESSYKEVSERSVAAVGDAPIGTQNSLLWILGTVGLIVAASVASVYLRRRDADMIRIID